MNEGYCLYDLQRWPPVAWTDTEPVRGGRPHVRGYCDGDEDPTEALFFDVACWCDRYRLSGSADVDAWIEHHMRQHHRPQWWVRRWATQLGWRLTRWGNDVR